MQAQMWTKLKKKKNEIIRKHIRTFGWGPHRQSGNSHGSDPLNSEAERAHEHLCNITLLAQIKRYTEESAGDQIEGPNINPKFIRHWVPLDNFQNG